METPEQIKGEQTERIKFDEAPEQEQVERFQTLESLFSDKNTDARGNYYDFLQNAYKYPDRLEIEGASQQQIVKFFEQARHGNEVIKDALDYFLQVKKNQGGIKNEMDNSRKKLEDHIFESRQFTSTKNKQLKIDKLISMFKWSLVAFIQSGERVGRIPAVRTEEIDSMCEDLETILEKVNQFR